jgi:hypothetical protein
VFRVLPQGPRVARTHARPRRARAHRPLRGRVRDRDARASGRAVCLRRWTRSPQLPREPTRLPRRGSVGFGGHLPGGVERLEDTGCGRVSPPPAQQLAALRHGIDTAHDGPPADQGFLRYPSFFYLKADGPVGTLNRNPPPATPSNCGRTPFQPAMACCWGPGC